jgi:MFS transporter, DHA1 family, multidrug resistance protein
VAGALLDALSYQAAFGSAVVLMLAASVYALRMPRDRLSVPVSEP